MVRACVHAQGWCEGPPGCALIVRLGVRGAEARARTHTCVPTSTHTHCIHAHLHADIHAHIAHAPPADFLVRTSDSLAVLYNDRSPMENHHLAVRVS